jgi:hypothetical protein
MKIVIQSQKWTFCKMDVLYSERSVTRRLADERLVTGRFVTESSVTRRFVNTGSQADVLTR